MNDRQQSTVCIKTEHFLSRYYDLEVQISLWQDE